MNLICTILTGLGTLGLGITYFTKKKEDDDDETREMPEEDEEKVKKHGFLRTLSTIPAVGSIIAFVLTEDMRNQMAMVDKWTLMMVGILAVNVVVMALSKKKYPKNDEDNVEFTKEA